MSSTDNVFVLHNLIAHMLNQGKNCVVVLLISIKLSILFSVIAYGRNIKLGIRGKMLKSMYSRV